MSAPSPLTTSNGTSTLVVGVCTTWIKAADEIMERSARESEERQAHNERIFKEYFLKQLAAGREDREYCKSGDTRKEGATTKIEPCQQSTMVIRENRKPSEPILISSDDGDFHAGPQRHDSPPGEDLMTQSRTADPNAASLPKHGTSDAPASSKASKSTGDPLSKLSPVFTLVPKKRVNPNTNPDQRPKKKIQTAHVAQEDFRTLNNMPDWYDSPITVTKISRTDKEALEYLRTVLFRDIQRAGGNQYYLTQIYERIRQRLHEMEFYSFLCPAIIKASRVLENDGLRMIFKNNMNAANFPWDIRADARALYNKWWNHNTIDPNLFRGIDLKTKDLEKKGGRSYAFEPGYPGRISCESFGNNGLTNGQWWPRQCCAMRDGAHGEPQAGIHGHENTGAWSIILASGGYEDVDEGINIQYCGTQGKDGQASAATNAMLKSFQDHRPIRVIRSSKLPAKNVYRPLEGLRYDGLYEIQGHELLNQSRCHYRFKLRRSGGQDPIRSQGPAIRPNAAELQQYRRMCILYGIPS